MKPAPDSLKEAERIAALNGAAARNEISACDRASVLQHLSRLERAGKNRTIILDRIPGRLRKLGETETALPADPEEFYRQVRESGETGCFCAALDPADRPCVKHEPVADPVQVQTPPPDPPFTITCTRCQGTTAAGEEQIQELFGWRTVPIKGGTKRVHQPQCRGCRSLPPLSGARKKRTAAPAA